MSISNNEVAHVADLFSEIGEITHRKMMGGATFYCNGAIFAILSSAGTIYLKAKDDFAAELAAEGSEIFSMTRKDGSIASMGYWTLPDQALDEPSEACEWAKKALIANSGES